MVNHPNRAKAPMTSAHFKLIASVLAAFPCTPAVRMDLTNRFCDALERHNPLFRADLFIAACEPRGPDGGEV